MPRTSPGYPPEYDQEAICDICGLPIPCFWPDWPEDKSCKCIPCGCGVRGDPLCINEHHHIPDPVLVSEAAKIKGVSPDTIRRWFNKGWIEGQKVAKTRNAPILVSLYEVKRFTPPKKGWPKGLKRCRTCHKPMKHMLGGLHVLPSGEFCSSPSD